MCDVIITQTPNLAPRVIIYGVINNESIIGDEDVNPLTYFNN